MIVPQPAEKLSLLFRMVTLAGGVFVLTVFVMIAAAFSPDETPAVRAVNERGGTILLVEVLITAALSLAAMTADRMRTLRELRRKNAARLAAAGRSSEGPHASHPSEAALNSQADALEAHSTNARPADDADL